jgi:cyclic pyranopterin phosphate synthase
MRNFLFNYFDNLNTSYSEINSNFSKDDFRINSLRISLISDCNENCFYCHNEGIARSSRSNLRTGDILHTINLLREYGLKKIKLTGGEPFLYKELKELIYSIKRFEDLKVLITTNGTLLKRRINDISPAVIDKISVSLDTLNKDQYTLITGKNLFNDVLCGLKLLRERGFNVEIDCLLLKNINTSKENLKEVLEYCSDNNFDLQFIELSNSGHNDIYKKYYINPIKVLEAIDFDFRTEKFNDRKFIKYKNINVTLCRSIKDICQSSNGRCSGLRMLPDGSLKEFYYI